MTIGIIAVAVAFIAAVVSTTAYFLYYRNGQEELLVLANRTFILMGAGVLLAIVLLGYLIQIHDFRVDYVYSYSSRALNKFYLFSTLWAGQQGTFLMWLTYGFIFGLVMMPRVARKNPLAMVFLLLAQVWLLLILLKKSPFSMIWHIHQEVPIGFMPADGNGLNPLLQNPWMVVHPPTLFVGYSSTVVAFAFAMSALVRRDWSNWIKEAKPWVIFNVLILGAGIILGGYWAYITLGWGGYWGWDPVENASLVPWLFSIVLLHGIIIQARRQSLVRTNLLWAGMAFLTMLWGSFLTRSGVLTDFSVHSFGKSGLFIYLVLLQVFFTGLFFYFYFDFLNDYRKKKAEIVEIGPGFFSREMFIFMGMMTVLFTAIFVLLGTSAPIYTGIFGVPSSLSPDFYNSMLTPIAVFMLITIGVAPVLAWKTPELRKKAAFIWAAVASFMVTVVAVLLGLSPMKSIGESTIYTKGAVAAPDIMMQIKDFAFEYIIRFAPYLLFFLAVFLIILNIDAAYSFLKRNPRKSGGYLAHVGIGFMVIGILTSSVYDVHEKVMLPKGEFLRTELGYEVKFVNFVDSPDGKDRVKLVVRNPSGSEYEAYPQFYYSDFSRAYMVSPDVKARFTKDIYISPISFTPAKNTMGKTITLGKQQTEKVENLEFTFNKFLVKMGGGFQEVTADLTVRLRQNGQVIEHNVLPILKMSQGEKLKDPVDIPGTQYKVAVDGVNASSGEVKLLVVHPGQDGADSKDMLAIEISEKPLISLLWFGTLVFMAGSFISLVGRRRTGPEQDA